MSMNKLRMRLTQALAALIVAACLPSPAPAMQSQVFGDQLILSGMVVADDAAMIERNLAANPGITTIILRNSPGGDAPTGYRVGEMFRAKGLRTAVSGYCYSSCSRMFLGGKVRVFTDDYPPDDTNVGFHGHYDSHGRLVAQYVRSLGLKDWIIKYSDGKADPALVERWINIPVASGMAHFFSPTLLRGKGGTTFMCQGTEASHSIFGCEAVPRTALELGVITSLDVIASNDQAALRATFPGTRPAPSGFASVGDMTKVPLATDPGRQNYQRYLSAPFPRAFAIAPDGRHWAWNAGGFDAMPLALSRCTERAGQPCSLYAVDDDVVWRTP